MPAYTKHQSSHIEVVKIVDFLRQEINPETHYYANPKWNDLEVARHLTVSRAAVKRLRLHYWPLKQANGHDKEEQTLQVQVNQLRKQVELITMALRDFGLEVPLL